MRIGLNTDSLGDRPLDEVLRAAADLGLDCVEFATGAWSSAPHVDVDALLESEAAQRELRARLDDHGLALSALTCSGNPLHPGESGREHNRVTRATIRLARRLGVERVIMMSGCPAAPGDAQPNWITVSWPPETTRVLEWQWQEVALPYWRELVRLAEKEGVRQLCLEMHGQQLVYNVPTLLRLREAVGPVVGANYDPSHLMWMGADPIAAIEALGEAIYHVHAKDTRLDPRRVGLRSRLETLPAADAKERSWSYVTLGYGHDEGFWREFCLALRRVGYDDVLSIEHEDMLIAPLEGIRKSVELLRAVILVEPPGFALPSV